MCPPYSHPYIMDLEEMQNKLEGHRPPVDKPLTPEKLRKIILEFTRLEGHTDEARALCSQNIGKIINGEDPDPYCTIVIPTT